MDKKFFTVKHSICEFVFEVNANPFKKDILLYNCICPKCKKELKDKYVIMTPIKLNGDLKMNCPKCKLQMIEPTPNFDLEQIYECGKVFPTVILCTKKQEYICPKCELIIVEKETKYYYL